MAASQIDRNVTTEVKGDKLVITIPLDKKQGQPSQSGKMTLTAKTAGGFTTVPGTEGFRLMLNAGYKV